MRFLLLTLLALSFLGYQMVYSCDMMKAGECVMKMLKCPHFNYCHKKCNDHKDECVKKHADCGGLIMCTMEDAPCKNTMDVHQMCIEGNNCTKPAFMVMAKLKCSMMDDQHMHGSASAVLTSFATVMVSSLASLFI